MAKDATAVDLSVLENVDWDGELTEELQTLRDSNPQMFELLKASTLHRREMKEQVDKKAGEKKAREPKNAVAKLDAALAKPPKDNLMEWAVTFLRTGQNKAGDQTADPAELLRSFGDMLEQIPGVTVDRDKLEPSDTVVQWNLRLYNLPESRSYAPPKNEKSAPDHASSIEEDDDENGEGDED